MRPEDRDPAYLLNVLKAAEDIAAFVRGVTLAEYRNDPMRQAAVERKLEVIGEAVRKLSETFRNAHPEVPAARIIGMRNILAHRYYATDHEIVWRVATVEIPVLASVVGPLIPPIPADPEPEEDV